MKKIILLILCLFPLGASAEKQVGEIIGFFPYEVGSKKLFFFQLKDNVGGGCNITARFAFDSNKVNFELMTSSLMAAYFSKTPVQVEYTQTCNTMGNSFDVSHICVGTIPC